MKAGHAQPDAWPMINYHCPITTIYGAAVPTLSMPFIERQTVKLGRRCNSQLVRRRSGPIWVRKRRNGRKRHPNLRS